MTSAFPPHDLHRPSAVRPCVPRGAPSAGGAGLWRRAGAALLPPAAGRGGGAARPAGGGGVRRQRRHAADAAPVAADDGRLTSPGDGHTAGFRPAAVTSRERTAGVCAAWCGPSEPARRPACRVC